LDTKGAPITWSLFLKVTLIIKLLKLVTIKKRETPSGVVSPKKIKILKG
jgi:hypothetical protein